MFSDLVGETLTKIEGTDIDSERITFETESGRTFVMMHYQDWCESVTIESVDSNLDDIIGHPIVLAEEVSNYDETGGYGDGCTYTYYTIASEVGTVVIRWYGVSNGYYSEAVDFTETTVK